MAWDAPVQDVPTQISSFPSLLQEAIIIKALSPYSLSLITVVQREAVVPGGLEITFMWLLWPFGLRCVAVIKRYLRPLRGGRGEQLPRCGHLPQARWQLQVPARV